MHILNDFFFFDLSLWFSPLDFNFLNIRLLNNYLESPIPCIRESLSPAVPSRRAQTVEIRRSLARPNVAKRGRSSTNITAINMARVPDGEDGSRPDSCAEETGRYTFYHPCEIGIIIYVQWARAYTHTHVASRPIYCFSIDLPLRVRATRSLIAIHRDVILYFDVLEHDKHNFRGLIPVTRSRVT